MQWKYLLLTLRMPSFQPTLDLGMDNTVCEKDWGAPKPISEEGIDRVSSLQGGQGGLKAPPVHPCSKHYNHLTMKSDTGAPESVL